jgi:hypothetical protein
MPLGPLITTTDSLWTSLANETVLAKKLTAKYQKKKKKGVESGGGGTTRREGVVEVEMSRMQVDSSQEGMQVGSSQEGGRHGNNDNSAASDDEGGDADGAYNVIFPYSRLGLVLESSQRWGKHTEHLDDAIIIKELSAHYQENEATPRHENGWQLLSPGDVITHVNGYPVKQYLEQGGFGSGGGNSSQSGGVAALIDRLKQEHRPLILTMRRSETHDRLVVEAIRAGHQRQLASNAVGRHLHSQHSRTAGHPALLGLEPHTIDVRTMLAQEKMQMVSCVESAVEIARELPAQTLFKSDILFQVSASDSTYISIH